MNNISFKLEDNSNDVASQSVFITEASNNSPKEPSKHIKLVNSS